MSLRRLSAFLLWLVLMAAAATSSAQQVVRWSGRVEASATVAPGGTVEVVLDATIDPGWKLYALTQEPGGPQALVIAAAPDSALALAAPPIGPLPFIAPDSNFNIDTQSHTESATFYVPLQVPATASGRLTGALTVTYQTCTDRFCLPPATDIVRVSSPYRAPVPVPRSPLSRPQHPRTRAPHVWRTWRRQPRHQPSGRISDWPH